MESLRKFSQCLLWLLLLFIHFASYPSLATPRLNKFQRKFYNKNRNIKNSTHHTDVVDVFYYSQTLDHFNYRPECYETFKQKYMIYSKHWGGAKAMAPILVYINDEAPLDHNDFHELIFRDYATRLNALVIMIEHRFYGSSIPFGMSMEEVLKDAKVRGYFNSAQALADCAELILHLKESFNAHYSPVIVSGGSYGGMLAAWFRLKYPHIALGALASSAPILYFDNIIPQNRGYYYVVSKDFKEISESCYNTIKESWSKIDELGSKPNGLSLLSKKFKTCTRLNNTTVLKDFLDETYSGLAQYESPSLICNGIDKGRKGKDVLSRINAGLVALSGDENCNNISDTFPNIGWEWQCCSEMVIPGAYGTSNELMFPRETFSLDSFVKDCKDKYGVLPRPHWVTTYYGGHDVKLVLKRFGSNIIFSNGLKDPYSSGGVLEDLSDSIIALYTTNGTHCKDILAAKEDDPKWLVDQRRREIEIIEGWLKQYYLDLMDYAKEK